MIIVRENMASQLSIALKESSILNALKFMVASTKIIITLLVFGEAKTCNDRLKTYLNLVLIYDFSYSVLLLISLRIINQPDNFRPSRMIFPNLESNLPDLGDTQALFLRDSEYYRYRNFDIMGNLYRNNRYLSYASNLNLL